MADEKAAEEEDEETPDSSEQQDDPNKMPLDQLRELVENEGARLEPDAEPEPEKPAVEVADAEAPPVDEAEALRAQQGELEKQQAALRHEAQEQKYKNLQEHASRLASRIGELEKQKREDSALGDAETHEPWGELRDGLRDVQRRLRDEEISRAIAEEISKPDPSLAKLDLAKEFAEVLPKHQDRYQKLIAMEDPREARLEARDFRLSIVSEAIGLRLQRGAEAATTGKAAQEKQAVSRKTAAFVSGSGGQRVAQKPKSLDPMTMPLDQLKATIDRLGGG